MTPSSTLFLLLLTVVSTKQTPILTHSGNSDTTFLPNAVRTDQAWRQQSVAHGLTLMRVDQAAAGDTGQQTASRAKDTPASEFREAEVIVKDHDCPDGIVNKVYNCTKSGLVCTESIPADLIAPIIDGCTPSGCIMSTPKPGRRVASVVPEFAHTSVFHTLYLPPDFTTARRWPLIVEFSGNGIEPQDGNWTVNGFGISEGRDYVWLGLPFVSAEAGNRTCNQRNWWGCDPSACDLYTPKSNHICHNKSLTQPLYDPEPTVRYAILAVRQTIAQFNVDPDRVLLTGHSRGALAVNYIGLYNDNISSLWSAFAPTSHYDGVKSWDFSNTRGLNLTTYRRQALKRLQRIGDRPVWVSAECDLATGAARRYLEGTGVNLSNFVIRGTGFSDHNSFWSLRPDPKHVRRDLRVWSRVSLGPG